MLMILRFENGKRTEGVLLAMDEERIRLAVPRLNETLELKQVDGMWLGEKGNQVEIESILFPSAEPAVLAVGHA